MIYRKTRNSSMFYNQCKKSNSDIRLLFFCPSNAIINSVFYDQGYNRIKTL